MQKHGKYSNQSAKSRNITQLETEKTKILTLFCTRVVLTAITALLNYYKNKIKESAKLLIRPKRES
jgi:hypothetical protein